MREAIFKEIFLFFIFLFSLLAFLPKENFYFYALEKLNGVGITVENEIFKSNIFGFSIASADIFYKGTNALHLEELEASSSLFTSKIEAHNGKIDGINLDAIDVSWSILHPTNVAIFIDSKDLKATGEYSLMTKQMTLFIKPTQEVAAKYQYLLEQCEKTQAGEYKLEYNL